MMHDRSFSLSIQFSAALLLAFLVPVVASADEENEQDFAAMSLEEAEETFEFSQTRTCTPDGLHRCDPGQEPLPVQWRFTPVSFLINSAGSRDIHGAADLTDELRDAVVGSFDAWNEQDCSDFEMHYGGRTESEFVGWNNNIEADENINIILWQDDTWPYVHYPAVALTTVTFRRSTGTILSADIEFNTADYNFTMGDENVDVDIKNTLTHEVGHFLGLDHSPNAEATMFATAPRGEISKRNLHPADIAGLCNIYPEGMDYDAPPERSGSTSDDSRCATAAGSGDPWMWLLVLALIGITARRRRVEGSVA